MASALTLKVGDTWPVMRLTASDITGLLPVKEADKIEFFMKGAKGTLVTGVLTVIDPPEEDAEKEKRNLKYQWAESDTSVADTYKLEIKIIWDEGTSPPHRQRVPNTGTATVTIEATV